ncbi:MAG: DUF1385 domain-containing protein [Epulopiscium sp.]|nr:DUF1385 domain-containing protein [Candidatus Epulonipiscium sp.]
MKQTSIGGQAVMEGVMMRGKNMYAIAVRKPDQEIIMDKQPIRSLSSRYSILKWPILRGILGFVESMVIGIKTLTYSASFFDLEESEPSRPSKSEAWLEKKLGDRYDDFIIGMTVVIAIILAIGLFMVAPLFITRFIHTWIPTGRLRAAVEGVIRILIFLIYIGLISQMKDIQRVFQYHGAEHKTINCYEQGEELTVENVRSHTRYHKRCGTSFLLIVMLVSIGVFMLIDLQNMWMRFLSRIVLVPFIAGLSYEIIRFAGRSDSLFVRLISYPGKGLQRLTTKEPDDDQIAVAICAMKGVLEDEGESYDSCPIIK